MPPVAREATTHLPATTEGGPATSPSRHATRGPAGAPGCRPFMLSLSYIVWSWNRTDEETLISNCAPIVNA